MTGTYEDAIIFAIHHHGAQTRWNGDPYITHPLRVAARAEKLARQHDYMFGPISIDLIKKTAILHDVVEDAAEDHKLPLYEEITKRFGSDVGDYVWTVSRRKDESYGDYILRVVRLNQLPLLVIKQADLEDSLSDLPGDHGLQKRYQFALKKIIEALKEVLGGEEDDRSLLGAERARSPIRGRRKRRSGSLTVGDAAEALECHPQTIRRYIRNGRDGLEPALRAVKRGGRWALTRRDIERFRRRWS